MRDQNKADLRDDVHIARYDFETIVQIGMVDVNGLTCFRHSQNGFCDCRFSGFELDLAADVLRGIGRREFYKSRGCVHFLRNRERARERGYRGENELNNMRGT